MLPEEINLGYNFKRPLYYGNFYEYDMKAAFCSIILNDLSKYIEYDDIQFLAKHKDNKTVRNIYIGNLQNKYEWLSTTLHDWIRHYIFLFLRDNNLTVEENVLFIKKDAVFINKPVKHTRFNEMQFIRKNSYIAYIKIDGMEDIWNGKPELYIKLDNSVDIKAVSASVKERYRYNFDFLAYIATLVLSSSATTVSVITKLKHLQKRYFEHKLDIKVYTQDSKVKYNNFEIDIDSIFKEELLLLKGKLEIEEVFYKIYYRFIKYIVELV